MWGKASKWPVNGALISCTLVTRPLPGFRCRNRSEFFWRARALSLILLWLTHERLQLLNLLYDRAEADVSRITVAQSARGATRECRVVLCPQLRVGRGEESGCERR